MHFKKDSMATILSLKSVSEIPGARITLDTDVSKNITLFLADGRTFVFEQYNSGLYYYDTKIPVESDKNNKELINYSFLNTVSNNKTYFTKQEIKGANTSRQIQEYLFFPSSTTLKKYVNNNLITNCKVNTDDINRAEIIYGPSEPYLEGHMVRRKPSIHDKIEKVPLPLIILQHHPKLALGIDFYFVNGNIFLLSKSQKVDFLTSQYCTSRSLRTIITVIEKVIHKYSCRGFEITDIHADNEFDKEAFKDSIEPILFHTYGREEHVGFIERPVRTIKERCRSTCSAMPYRRITILMARSLIEGVVHMLNAFPSKNGISDTISPATIIEGKPKLDLEKKMINFGSYALVYSGTTNNNKPRSVPAIALRRSNNDGGHYFMSLHSGKRIHGYEWEELPIDEHVIERVEALAVAEKQPIMHRGMPSFEWAPGIPIEDDDEIDPELQTPVNNDTTEEPLPIGIEETEIVEGGAVNYNMEEIEEEGLIIIPEDGIVSEEEDFVESEDENLDANETEEVEHIENEEVVVAGLDDDHEPTSSVNTRPRRTNAGSGVERLQMNFSGQGYDKKREFNLTTNGITERENKVEPPQHSLMQKACDIIFTQAANQGKLRKQMSATKGFKVYGKLAVAAMVKEFTQLSVGAVPGKPVVGPVDASTLTSQEKKKAMAAVNLIKEKWEGVIKGRTCADGSRQRKYLKQDESVASPTAALESLIVSLLIDAYEERDVGTYDVPGAYLHAKLLPRADNERVLMRLTGDFVGIMCKVNPEHEKNVIIEKGRKVLYLEILRALYGCIESALRWYELYSETLHKEGFTINPYDKCVANKMINGEQCTILWYVDDNKISHKDPKVVTEVIDMMKRHFGDLSITRGKTHRFLGMNITITEDKKLQIEMKEHLQEAIDMYSSIEGDGVNEVVTSPARPRLREVNDDCPKLTGDKREGFHSIVAKLLWTMKRARPDLETAIGFLCTRVDKSDTDDWRKLRRVIAFVKCTLDECRIIGATDLTKIFTWIDAAYAVNPDMKSQTGGSMSMGVGVIHARTNKQKLNVKSSTEAELVGNSDYLPYNIWLLHFLAEQGYEIKDNVLYQDNQSTIRMLKNGRNSCTGNSRHIDIRHFFVKDRVDKKEVRIEYCPTSIMLADFFTKPLQGQLFQKFRSVLMGWEPITILR